MPRRLAQPQGPPIPTAPRSITDISELEIDTGIALVGSDPHWTVAQPSSTATKPWPVRSDRQASAQRRRECSPWQRDRSRQIDCDRPHSSAQRRAPQQRRNRQLLGVDLGTMAALSSAAFSYTEGAASTGPAGWASSFGVFTWFNGRLLWPELVHVVDEQAGLVSFRGGLINVNGRLH